MDDDVITEAASSNGHVVNGMSHGSCAGCGKPLTGKQATWCSRSCQKKGAYRRNSPTPQPNEPAREVVQTRSADPLAALMSVGFRHRGHLLEYGGEPWILTRQGDNL